MKVRVFLVDDHGIVRDGLRMLLEREEDLLVIGEAATLEDALAGQHEPDVVLTDLHLPDASGSDAVAALVERYPDSSVVALTIESRPSEVRRALLAGARGYLLKALAASEVVEAIRRVARGEHYLDPSLGAAVVAGATDVAGIHALTSREREVLRLISFGHTNSEVASLLAIALRTVEAHRQHILRKLGVRTRAELVRHAIDAGLVDP